MIRLIKIFLGVAGVFVFAILFSELTLSGVSFSIYDIRLDPAGIGLISAVSFLIGGIFCFICASQTYYDIIFQSAPMYCFVCAGGFFYGSTESVSEGFAKIGSVGMILGVIYMVLYVIEWRKFSLTPDFPLRKEKEKEVDKTPEVQQEVNKEVKESDEAEVQKEEGKVEPEQGEINS